MAELSLMRDYHEAVDAMAYSHSGWVAHGDYYVAEMARVALAEKFGVSREDFSVLHVTNPDDSESLTLAYTVQHGINLGAPLYASDRMRCWNFILDKKCDDMFAIEVDGVKFDSRQGMTKAAYDAFIARYKDIRTRAIEVEPLEVDSMPDRVWATWLTGEEATATHAPIAYTSYDGGVCHSWAHRGWGLHTYPRFRPAVVICDTHTLHKRFAS